MLGPSKPRDLDRPVIVSLEALVVGPLPPQSLLGYRVVLVEGLPPCGRAASAAIVA